jgi:hypothetical protein
MAPFSEKNIAYRNLAEMLLLAPLPPGKTASHQLSASSKRAAGTGKGAITRMPRSIVPRRL